MSVRKLVQDGDYATNSDKRKLIEYRDRQQKELRGHIRCDDEVRCVQFIPCLSLICLWDDYHGVAPSLINYLPP